MKFRLKRKNMFFLSAMITILLIHFTALQAQTMPSPATQQMINTELQKRGLTEAEVNARLLQEGIDLQNIPPAQLPQYQARVTAILDKMEAEKKKGTNTAQPINIIVGNSSPATNAPATTDSTIVTKNPLTTPKEAAAEASQRVIQSEAAKNQGIANIYGHSLFTDKSLAVFRTTDGAQAPDTYVLGEGDEIHITIFGASQTDIQQRITPDGYIQPSGVSKIFLKGLTLAQARELIKKQLSSAYLYRSDQIAVTIITARTIMVNVFGEVNITGGFNISALNSALNALSVAGGPTNIGSVRNIQLIRGTTRKNIDIYAFMNDPSLQYKFDLQNNDILFVPVIQKLVSIEGAVNRPMSYEMLPNESLIDLIHFAGGLKMDAYPNFVQIKRYVDGEQKLMEWNLQDVKSGKVKVPLLNGDAVTIKAIGKPLSQYVDVEGSVYYPGRYDLSKNQTLSALLANAKPTYEAKTDILFVERTRPDLTVELLTVPFPNSKAGIHDFDLQARDTVRIMDLASYRDVATIAVNGQVRKPFEKSLSLNDHLTVKQAIEMAGGLKTSVYPVAYIFRRNIFNPTEVKYIRIELNQSDKMELQPGDQLNIYDNKTYTNVGEVRIWGAVKTPKSFTFDPSLSLHDLIINAGGFNVGAAFNRVQVFRTILSPNDMTKFSIITIQVDSNYQVIKPQNFSLQPYDQVVVRMTPDFSLNRSVEVNGQVKYPGVYVLNSKQTKMSDVIKMAGGLLPDADPNGTGLYRTYKNRGSISFNVHKSVAHPQGFNNNPILFEGDVININRLENTVSILERGTRLAQYSNDSIVGTRNVVFQGRRTAAWYIRNFAGGFQSEADRNSVTVTLPNNQMESTRHFLFFRVFPRVEPGSVITMQMKPPKPITTEAKKFDVDATLSRTLTGVTTVMTLLIMGKQLGL